jgi:hypothetical protein
VTDPGDNKPHGLRIWNDGPAREISVRVEGADIGVAVDRTVEFPANGYLSIELRQPDAYAVDVRTEDGAWYGLELGTEWFDCNASSTTLRLDAEGTASYVTISTMLACDPAEVATDADTDSDTPTAQ